MKMAIVHDLAECIVGDITPFCGISKQEKHRREEVSFEPSFYNASFLTAKNIMYFTFGLAFLLLIIVYILYIE